ncbi:heat repeat protein [Colletotrichum truncatum]|uniref:Heat repeat protein n=1 Tax=Colletotrichum truncatum TaxID=5467 RepID=A0ACC3YG02_COLTU|nr:heat repeat protein [Colletotrichum truncatum]KAF6784507.1 heat repeat protein [Colletotrichum truncatum]
MATSLTNATPARNEFFQQLKPCCVSISQLAIRPPEGTSSFKRLTELTTELFHILSDQINKDATVMDEKLADYVFFPLSHVFRNQEHHPKRLVELAVKCLTIIIHHGWKSSISPQIMQQLLILLTFIIGGVPGREETRDLPEETELESLRALTTLITVTGSSAKAAAALTEEKMVPNLGHTITVLLVCVTDGRTPEIQLEALRTLGCFYTGIRDHGALASFLPGVVSSLTKILAKPQREKTRVLVASIQVLKLVILQVLGDVKTRSITANLTRSTSSEAETGELLSPSWLKATSSQIKLALTTVLKLRGHESLDVRETLLALSLGLLDECHTTLETCASMLVESAIVLSSTDHAPSMAATSLQDLAIIYPELGETVKVTCYNWITSLPRIMQSADEGNKQSAIHNLRKGMTMVSTLQLDSSLLDESIAAALRESVTYLITGTKSSKIMDQVATDASWYSRDVVKAEEASKQYQLTLLSQESQAGTRSAIIGLLSQIGPPSQQTKLAAEMLDYARDATGDAQTASFWLSFELLKASLSRSNELDDLLDFSSLGPSDEGADAVFQEVYSFAVMVLDSHSELSEADWRLEATALEVTSFAASRLGEAFRPELIDVLYPTTTFLGSTSPLLREHTITTLNILAASCGYTSVSELIIENVDYMINSISLRLNTFDISPASTKVLVMMTRLTGPRLLPYLDDVVASIFAALDNYHGYPLFVESLFSVLKEVVNQGAKSDKLLLEGRQNGSGNHKKVAAKPVTIEDIIGLLKQRQNREKKVANEAEEEEPQGHPQQPWGTEKAADEDEVDNRVDKEKPPKTPTYILLEKITSLTQHYLTSSSPTLRKSLLDLLATVSPALSGDEDSFLPLINVVWPVVITRLYDQETFVSISACDSLSILCVTAGDFLSSRIKTEWWDGLGKWCRAKKMEAARAQNKTRTHQDTDRISERTAPTGQGIIIPIRSDNDLLGQQSTDVAVSTVAGGLGKFSQAAQIWEAVVRLLTAIVSHVRIEAEIFDEFLELMAEVIQKNPEARQALEAVNSDAVWFALYQRGHIEAMRTPQLDGYTFTPLPRMG